MICKNCKYYYETTIEFLWAGLERQQEGHCSNPLIYDDTKEGNGECPDNGLYATCDEGRGAIIIGPNFGCIHFKEKVLQ